MGTENRLQVEGLGGKGEGIEMYRLVVSKQSWRCKVEHRKRTQQYCNNCVWCGWALEMSGGTLYKVYDYLTNTLYTLNTKYY